MKKAKIIILIAILLIGGFVLVRLWVNLQERKASEAEVQIPNSSTGEASQELQKVHFVEDKHGRKTWELEAKTVRLYQEENTSVLEDVKVTFYAKEGRIFYLTAKQGKVHQDSKDVELTGNVVLTSNDGYQLKTQSASYQHSEKTVSTSDPVEIEGEQIRLTGRGMLVNMEDKTFKVLSQVKTQLKGRKRG
jgi:LPS export ABC transporter protein LptC